MGPEEQRAWAEPAGQGAWVELAGQGAWVAPAGQGAWRLWPPQGDLAGPFSRPILPPPSVRGL